MKTATICFLVEDNKILLANKKRSFGQGYLNGYGGKAGEGEDATVAAICELKEESGISATTNDLERVAVIDFFIEEKQIFECHVFFVRNWKKEELVETEEMAYPEEFELQNLPLERMWKGDTLWLPIIYKGEKIKAKVVYKEGMKEVESFEYSAF